MRKIFLSIITLCFFTLLNFTLEAQNTRWPYAVDGSMQGRGIPYVWSYGYNSEAAAVLKDNKEGKKIKPGKKPQIIHFYFEPFDACQAVVTETYNPGAIIKIEIGYKPGKKLLKKVVWEGTAKATEAKYTVRNFYFDTLQNITDVWMYVDYSAVDGPNQYGGLCLVNSKKEYYPKINLPKAKIFTENTKKLNDDIDGRKNPAGLIMSADNRYLYFSHMDNQNRKMGEQIYRAELDSSKQIVKVELSDFNLPKGTSKTCGLIGISQDNNTAYVSDMRLDRFQFYKTYLGKSMFGSPKWKHEKQQIKNYKNGGLYIDYVMSYDGNIIILGYKEKSKHGDLYEEDLYVSIKDEKGKWGDFKHMGFDLNTLGTETPCYLASDNKTLYFSSTGRLGFGMGDIYVTKRQDETWTKWSEPLNLGQSINTDEHENSFVLDGQSGRFYFIRFIDDELSDIYTAELYVEPPAPIEPTPIDIPELDTFAQDTIVMFTEEFVPPSLDEIEEDEIMPEPVIIVSGITTNIKDGSIIQAEIEYFDIITGKTIGKAISNAETGEYTIVLRKGVNYAFDASAEGFIGESHSINTTDLKEFGKIKQDFALTPIEKDITIRLNNIFFDTDKSELLPASYTELEKLLKLLNQNPNIKIEISGHTDNVGSQSYNQKLSERRAKAVRDYLVSKGIKDNRVLSAGYGMEKPVVENDTQENRALNRRVEFTILEVK